MRALRAHGAGTASSDHSAGPEPLRPGRARDSGAEQHRDSGAEQHRHRGAEQHRDRGDRPDAWLPAWLTAQARAGQFAGTVLIAAGGGRVLLDRGYGFADRATHTPDTPVTRYCVASIGKLFTAVAIGQLAQRGRVHFSAPVGAYVQGLPAEIARITVGQLLDMTGGLGDVVLGRAEPPRSLDAMVALIAHERPQQRPGSAFLYSNDDYILLGAVVQSVSHMGYAAYIRTHIFGPAGMTGAGYSTYVPRRVAGMAHGYALIGNGLRDIGSRPQIANPSGGAYATAGDLFRFAEALLHGRLLTPAMTATLLKPRVASPQPGGPAVDEYTYGFGYQRINGVAFVGHNGGTPGYEGQLDIYPRSGDVAIVLANQDGTMIPVIQRSEQLLTGAGVRPAAQDVPGTTRSNESGGRLAKYRRSA